MGYRIPADFGISDDWQDHVNRNSAEPGTDYRLPYGTGIACAFDGVVSVVDNSNQGAEGRRISVDLSDGRRVSYIHNSHNIAKVGQRVKRGQIIALSGASGFGRDWYYGPHSHVTLWERPGMSYRDTLNFERFVGDEKPSGGNSSNGSTIILAEDEEMKNCGVYYEKSKNTWVYLIFNTSSGWYHEFGNGDNAGKMTGEYNNPFALALDTNSWAKITPGHAAVIKSSLDAVKR